MSDPDTNIKFMFDIKRLDDFAARLAVLDATVGWLAVSGEQLLSLLFAAG
jgi:hypothetical protein